MNILIIGNGGREHALAWKAAQSPWRTSVPVAPAMPAPRAEANLENVAIAATDIPAWSLSPRGHDIGLTIVGPEAPLVIGVVDPPGRRPENLRPVAGRRVNSKAQSLSPRISWRATASRPPNMKLHRGRAGTGLCCAAKGAPIVIKADGLAAGKGVIVAMTLQGKRKKPCDMLAGNAFGDAGHRIVVEEFLDGEEASFIVMVDGENVVPMATSQDHKRVGDGDTGEHRRRMGLPPAPVDRRNPPARHGSVIWPTVRGMAAEGNTYVGFLYAGLMIAADGQPKVIEFNCRFGDPETQPIMLRLRSDLVELCLRVPKAA
ncbi:phosphoribosylamine--glycine ligase [Serratia ureilytica]